MNKERTLSHKCDDNLQWLYGKPQHQKSVPSKKKSQKRSHTRDLISYDGLNITNFLTKSNTERCYIRKIAGNDITSE